MTINSKGRSFQISIEDHNKTKLLEKAASELLSIMFDMRKVHGTQEFELELNAESFETLALEFLQEILEMIEINAIVFEKFKVKIIKEETEYKLFAKLSGESISEHHRLKKQVFMVLPQITYKNNKLTFLVE